MTERPNITGPRRRRPLPRVSRPGARGLPSARGLLIAGLLAIVCMPAAGVAQDGPYLGRVISTPPVDGPQEGSRCRRLPPVSEAFSAWWTDAVHRPLRTTAQPQSVSIESLILDALEYSSQVRVMRDLPLIRRTSIVEAEADFDWTAFIDGKWQDIDEPVGNFLKTGGPPRFLNEDLDYRTGLRRRNLHGGRFEIAQGYGWENSNSDYFIPKNQGTARLALSYTQPLRRGAGVVYNSSLIVLARIDTQIAYDELSEELQAYLIELVRAYWELYLQRGAVLQKQRAIERTCNILEQLELRADIDAPISQIARARAAVAWRRAELVRAEAAVDNGETQIHALVNAPCGPDTEMLELVPMDVPSREFAPVNLREAVQIALRERPEIDKAMRQIRASATQLQMSKNELLPVLDLILETYVNGLEGNSDIPQAFGDEFSEGAPSYSVGLQFEMPLHNRAARARFERRQLELRQVTNALDATAQNLTAEVKIAVRDVGRSYQEMEAKLHSMQATQTEVNYLLRRWEELAGDDRTGSLALNDLLDAQDRLTIGEFGFLSAQVEYNVALMDLKKATGTLLKHEQISPVEIRGGHVPELLLDKPAS